MRVRSQIFSNVDNPDNPFGQRDPANGNIAPVNGSPGQAQANQSTQAGNVNGSNGQTAQQAQTNPNNPEAATVQNELSEFAKGHGSGCGDCVARMGGIVSSAQLDKLRNGNSSERAAMVAQVRNAMESADNSRESEVIAHENAHSSAAGALGGGIQYDYNSRGKIVGGRVPISMPSLNKSNPERTIQQASMVMRAALAPASPSSQDRSVASAASGILSKAQSFKSNMGGNPANKTANENSEKGKQNNQDNPNPTQDNSINNNAANQVAPSQRGGSPAPNSSRSPVSNPFTST